MYYVQFKPSPSDTKWSHDKSYEKISDAKKRAKKLEKTALENDYYIRVRIIEAEF